MLNSDRDIYAHHKLVSMLRAEIFILRVLLNKKKGIYIPPQDIWHAKDLVGQYPHLKHYLDDCTVKELYQWKKPRKTFYE